MSHREARIEGEKAVGGDGETNDRRATRKKMYIEVVHTYGEETMK